MAAKRTPDERMDNLPRPREGLVGAHDQRRETERERSEDEPSREPVGAGADVAPTRRAEERERERHRLQREKGVVPAGTDGNPRQQRAPGADREALDDAAREADESVRDRRR